MDQKWIHIVVILVFYEKITSGAGDEIPIQEGNSHEIRCHPSMPGTMIVWFRVLDKSGMEFIASYSNSGLKKPSTSTPSSTFVDSKIRDGILILKSFNKVSDSGVYSCASLYGGTELKFGQVTRLVGEKTRGAQLATTTTQNLCTTATPCVCNNNNNKGETSPSMLCDPIIWGPLVGGCGLLLLLLFVTILYCNTIRTRRCPHHYKRKPRMTAGGKQVTTNRHV